MDECFLYALKSNDFVKVGVSHDVPARMRELQVGCPIVLSLVACVRCANRDTAMRLERTAHTTLATWWYHGEWFRYNGACRHALLDLFEGW